MQKIIRGKVWKYGDNINTDVIIPARYAACCLSELSQHCMEDLDPNFVKKVKRGDILVAGKNFGCGSSREFAPIAIQGAGISCVIAKSFARIFFRNSINMAFPIFELEEIDRIEEGDKLEINPSAGEIKNLGKNEVYKIKLMEELFQKVMASGGLLNLVIKGMEK
ncbi:3-isopropylmalate dehydratase small subunit [Candidatus Woesearchaeota archaeon]|nr:3-isopropylmalate dehydratase small subunit [Candidatus Woesearchaeota archaeon]